MAAPNEIRPLSHFGPSRVTIRTARFDSRNYFRASYQTCYAEKVARFVVAIVFNESSSTDVDISGLAFTKNPAASLARAGIPIVLRKSPPVPLGTIPNFGIDPEINMPLATSEIVPSHRRQRSVLFLSGQPQWPTQFPDLRFSVNFGTKGPKCVASALAIFGQASRVAPPADSGLIITKVKS